MCTISTASAMPSSGAEREAEQRRRERDPADDRRGCAAPAADSRTPTSSKRRRRPGAAPAAAAARRPGVPTSTSLGVGRRLALEGVAHQRRSSSATAATYQIAISARTTTPAARSARPADGARAMGAARSGSASALSRHRSARRASPSRTRWAIFEELRRLADVERAVAREVAVDDVDDAARAAATSPRSGSTGTPPRGSNG